MIDSDTYKKCGEKTEAQSKSLMDLLKQDVSVKSVHELLTMEIGLSTFTGSAKKKKSSPLRDALSQPLYATDDGVRHIVSAWRPPIEDLVNALDDAAALDRPKAEALEIIGKGPGAYNRLVEKGYLNRRTLNQVTTNAKTPLRKLNRLHLALALLKFNDVLSQEDCDEILDRFQKKGDEEIPRLNKEITAFVESEPDMPGVDPREVNPGDALRRSLPVTFIHQNLFLPLRRSKGVLEIVMADPFYVALTDSLSLLTGLPVLGFHAPEPAIIARVNEIFPAQDASATAAKAGKRPAAEAPPPEPSAAVGGAPREAAPEEMADSRSAVELVSSIIEGGVEHRATDVHLEPRDGALHVRYRIDGRLRKVLIVPPALVLSVVSRIKVLANLDVTERRRPQDGHFSLTIGEGAFDFRVSTLPTHLGEKVVIRILDASRVMHSLEDLGMLPDQCKRVGRWISRPHGMLLVTGPTGAGKTSTLYAALNSVNSETKNVVTIEDPVEYRLEGINQVQVEPHFDLNFASGLRSILRQDPDIIMVGEVRDPETARIAMRAALTGHMVFSTLHTNTAAGAIATLGQMGIEPYMVTTAVTGIVNQRLVRRLCGECKKRFTPTQALLHSLKIEEKSRKRMYRAEGCPRCLNTGYLGRVGVFELMAMGEEIIHAILERRSEPELTALARRSGFPSLLEIGVAKIHEGVTSPEEIMETIITDE